MKVARSSRRKHTAVPRIDLRSDTYAVSKAKTYLGRLMDKAAEGKAVYIVKGSRSFVLQLVPEIAPIPMRPPGFFANCYTREEIQTENRISNASPVEKPHDLE
jgi:hypothetical protein